MENYNFISNYHSQNLATQIHKVTNDISPAILNNVDAQKATHYNRRNPVSFKMEKSHLGANLCSLVVHDIGYILMHKF